MTSSTGVAEEVRPADLESDTLSTAIPQARTEIPEEDVAVAAALLADLPTPEAPTAARRGSDRELAKKCFAEMASLPEGDPRRARLRRELVEMHIPLAEFFARRFAGRGENTEDLIQVATVGLIKAVDRFDLDRGVEFSTFAAPTIIGEVKRHFRDKGWAVRVPRRLQELRLAISKAVSELYQKLGHSPTVAELAVHLKVTEEEILEGLESGQAYTASSLDTPGSDGDGLSIGEQIGGLDPGIDQIELRESLKPLLAQLPEREKKILMMRFFNEMTQSQIAQELGISQMHVSRLLTRTLAQLRAGLFQEA